MNFALAPTAPPRSNRRPEHNARSRPKADNNASHHLYAEVDEAQVNALARPSDYPEYTSPGPAGCVYEIPRVDSDRFLTRHSTGSSLSYDSGGCYDNIMGADDDDDLSLMLAAGMQAMAVGGPSRCHTPPIYEDFGLEAMPTSFVPRNTFSGALTDPKVELKRRLMKIATDGCGVTCLEPQTTAIDRARAVIGASKTRLQAETHLREAGSETGMFLFRESKGLMVLSMSDGTAFHHLKVESKGVTVPASQFGEDEFKKFVGHYSQPQNKLPAVLCTLLVC